MAGNGGHFAANYCTPRPFLNTPAEDCDVHHNLFIMNTLQDNKTCKALKEYRYESISSANWAYGIGSDQPSKLGIHI